MKLLIALLSCVIGVCGCAHMTINVSIFDRKFWSSPEHLSNSISEQVAAVAIKRGNGTFARAQEEIKTQARQALYDLVQKNAVDPSLVPLLGDELGKFVDDRFREADDHFKEAFMQLGIASAVPPPSNRLAVLFNAQSELDAGRASISLAREKVSADVRKLITTAKSESKTQAIQSINQAESKIQTAFRGLIDDRGILEDPMASAVVFAPEKYWKRTESPSGINETHATGKFGNTDIAVKMEAVGDFTIKGVRLDASKITQATFAVGRQAIKTVAALYGIPMPTGAAKTPPPAPATPFAEPSIGFESPDRRRAAAEEALLRRCLARLALLETILIQRKALTNYEKTPQADAARSTAVTTVKEAFKSNRSLLDAPAASIK